jgi:hypothetical protein
MGGFSRSTMAAAVTASFACVCGNAMVGGSAAVSSRGSVPISGLGCHFLSPVPFGHLHVIEELQSEVFVLQ